MKPYVFPFEKLEVWKEARAYVREIYETTASFPSNEQFGLTAQIRRAAVSVSSNIAEDDGRFSTKDQLRFFYAFLVQFDGSFQSAHHCARSWLHF